MILSKMGTKSERRADGYIQKIALRCREFFILLLVPFLFLRVLGSFLAVSIIDGCSTDKVYSSSGGSYLSRNVLLVL